jgi:hypothetical protein
MFSQETARPPERKQKQQRLNGFLRRSSARFLGKQGPKVNPRFSHKYISLKLHIFLQDILLLNYTSGFFRASQL